VQGLPTDYASRYAPLVESLPIGAVAREAQRLTPEQLLIVAVGDRKQIEPELKKRGHTLEIAAEKLLE
jgi:hypothetical protein